MGLIKLFFALFTLTLCNAQEPFTPLSVANPYHVISRHLSVAHFKRQQALSFQPDVYASLTNPQLLLKNISHNNETLDSCGKSLIKFAEDLSKKEYYALRMVDAWGKPESGIMEGNLKWAGLYYECLNAKSSTFKPKYCSVFVGQAAADPFGLNAPTGITWAGCFPDTCTEPNITSLFFPIVHSALKLNSTVATTCPVSETAWDGKDIFGLIVLCLLVATVIASTLCEVIISRRSRKYEYFDDASSPTDVPKIDLYNSMSKTEKLLCSFSIIQNTKRLLVTKQRPTDIHCLHGMRFLSMSWVILGHSFIFPIAYTDNLIFLARYYVEHLSFQAVGNATFSVDSFFFLSGLLVVYLGLRQLKKTNGKMNVPMMYLYRYIRLTPPYALLILLSVSVWPKLGTGPMWGATVTNQQESCAKYWYTNLLYFNNLYPAEMNKECYAWGWYLANDMQFYLLSPIFLYLLYRFPVAGLVSMGNVALFSIAITGAFSTHTQQQPQPLGIGLLSKAAINSMDPPTNTSVDNLGAEQPPTVTYDPYVQDLYAKPWCRIGAYMVGMLTGYAVYTYSKKIKMPSYVAICGWLAAAAMNLAVLYGLYPDIVQGNILDLNTAAFYNAMSRPIWCVGLAWVVIACTSGYGGPINTFLSWKGFIPLSRLTYSTYLVHPMVIWWLVATSEVLIHNSIQNMLMVFSGTMILSTMFAYVVAMIIEFPIIELTKLLLNRDNASVAIRPEAVTVNGFEANAPLVDEPKA